MIGDCPFRCLHCKEFEERLVGQAIETVVQQDAKKGRKKNRKAEKENINIWWWKSGKKTNCFRGRWWVGSPKTRTMLDLIYEGWNDAKFLGGFRLHA